MSVLQTVECTSAILVIVTLFLIGRHYRWWLAYAANSILFAVVSYLSGVDFFALMGCFLCVTAVRNYFIAKKKDKNGKI